MMDDESSGGGGAGGGADDGGAARAREILLEAAASAYRARSPASRLQPSAAWRDLTPDDRVRAARIAAALRALEAGVDPDGLSTASRAVLGRIRG